MTVKDCWYQYRIVLLSNCTKSKYLANESDAGLVPYIFFTSQAISDQEPTGFMEALRPRLYCPVLLVPMALHKSKSHVSISDVVVQAQISSFKTLMKGEKAARNVAALL